MQQHGRPEIYAVNRDLPEGLMRNKETWRPSKFVIRDGTLTGSRDPSELGIRSRMIGDVGAQLYWDVIRKHAGGVLADVGCGKVPLYETYRDLVSDVICIDWIQTWHTSPHLDIEADLNRGLPLLDAVIDTILATDVLEHLRKPDLFWSEVARVLRPHGKVILSSPFLYWLHEEPHDYHRFTKHQLRSACEERELSILEIHEVAGPLTVILDIVGKSTPWLVEPYQTLASWFQNSRLGKRIDERGIASFPLGYCLVAQKP
jgi:SAM-dependent methyltransferase